MNVEHLDQYRNFFQKERDSVVDFMEYHKKLHDNKSLDYNMNIIDTPESRKYKVQQIPNKGDIVLKGIIRTLNNLKRISLYDYQLNFVKVVIPTLFKYIYRDEWREKREEILFRHGMADTYDEVFFTSPRRMGKTITLAYTCMAIMVNVHKDYHRDFDIAVFATGIDASKRFIDECELGWKNLDKNSEFYFQRTATQIKITRKSDPGDIRIMNAYCGSGPVRYTTFSIVVVDARLLLIIVISTGKAFFITKFQIVIFFS